MYQVDKNGFYGEFGGAYVPEILYKCVKDLQEAYLPIIESEEFKQEYHALLKDYVGRPSPLYYAKRMSEQYGCQLYLKREDLNHTGAHKINNTIGQILLAKKMGKTRIIAETGAGQHGVATATVCALMNMKCGYRCGAPAHQRRAHEDAGRRGASCTHRQHDAERCLQRGHPRLVLSSCRHLLYCRQHDGSSPLP